MFGRESSVELFWSTASEIDNNFFTVQRSSDGKEYESLFEVTGAGNSFEILEYTAYDDHPFYGLSFYRIKQTDFDGRFDFSSVASVFLENTETEIKVFPNPVTAGVFTITLPGYEEEMPLTIKLYSTSGNLIDEQSYLGTPFNGNLEVRPQVQLSGGVYILHLIIGEQHYAQRLRIE